MNESLLEESVDTAKPARSWTRHALTALLCLGLIVSTHLVPLLANGIATVVAATTGLNTTTLQAQSETKIVANVAETLGEELKVQAETLTELQTELTRQKSHTESAESALVQAYAALEAAQITIQAQEETQERVVTALQDTITDNRAEMERLLVLRANALKTVFAARARIKRMAASNVGATLGESIPFVGIGVIVAGTTYEMYESCEAMDEMTTLLEELDPLRTPDDGNSHAEMCGLDIPSKEEIWATIRTSPSAAWSATQSAVGNFDWMKNVDGPDFSRVEAWFRHVF